MKILDKSKYYKQIQKANIKLFKRNRNSDFKFTVHPLTKKSPLTLIPEPLYKDFERDKYKRHKIKFPINVPIYYRNVLVPKEYKRYRPVKRTQFNYGHCSGNQILLSLMNYKEYLREELLEMFFQLTNKKNVINLNLEENKIVSESFKFMFDRLEEMTVKEVFHLFRSIYKLNFKREGVYEKIKRIVMSKIYNFELTNTPNDLAFFIIKIDKKVGFTSEETELLLEQIPRYLKEMTPENVLTIFELLLKKSIIKDPLDYLFEYHFFMYFWKKVTNFSLSQLTRIIKGLRQINYFKKDNEYIIDDLIPALINSVKIADSVLDIEEAMSEIEGFIGEGVDHLELDDVREEFQKRINFIEKKMKVVSESNIIFMVKKDIKEFARISREVQSQQEEIREEVGVN